jgi:prepilin-type N-terminal cleavage/methylation domain-containing protein/prepilin-type processing-associated H-X9-DG protein
MKTSSGISAARPYGRAKAFTLIELLVVITIVIVLAAIVFTVTKNVRRSATKVADMNNLRNLAAAAMAAGSDNAGRLPQIHDLNSVYPYYLVGKEKLQAAGIFKEACYAPSKNIMGGSPQYEWWFRSDANTPVHYVYFANDADNPASAWYLKNGKVEPPTMSEYRGDVPYNDIIKQPVKAFPRTFTDQPWYPVLWAGLCREYGNTTVAAMMEDGKALGVNVMYLDGHVEWLDAKKMKARYTGGGVKVFW